MATLEGFKRYARLPPDSMDDDRTAELCYDAAVQSAKDAGIPDFLLKINDAKYSLYIYALALYWYENRGFMPVGTQNGETQKLMTKMRFELKYRRDDTGADEGG